MCGIAGVWHKNKEVNDKDIAYFKKALFHRGPDAQLHQLFDENKGAVVHTRLSIIDLTNEANQPLVSDCGRYSMVFNGEIFNYLELKKELEVVGQTFRTNSDTEVLLKAYITWGQDCLHKLNGMWAFCIWDAKERNMFLSRDRYGIKPLYFIDSHNYFAFASESLAFNEVSFYDKRLNDTNLQIALKDADKLEGLGLTIYEQMYQLMPGHVLKYNHCTGIVVKRWYNLFEKIKPYKGSYGNAIADFKALFFDACKLRLRSDVPTATALSGGVDSSAVYCTIQEILKEQGKVDEHNSLRQAYTASFKGMPQDESDIAAATVKENGGGHFLSSDNLENITEQLERSVLALDTISTGSILSLQNVYGAMKKGGITVSMDGHGADELMYGYRHQISELFFSSLQKAHVKSTPQLLGKVLGGMKAPNNENHYQTIVETKFNGVKNWVRNHFKSEKVLTDQIQLKYGERYQFNHLSYLEKDLYQDFLEYTLPNIFRNFDRASMTHAVEIRMPFMDYRIVEFLFSLPFLYKITEQGKTKQILRDAMYGIVPKAILKRTVKIGVNTPVNSLSKVLQNSQSWEEFCLLQIKNNSTHDC